MMNLNSRLYQQIVACFVLLAFLAFFGSGQTNDPNPDSPTPILISEADSVRALATSPDKLSSTTRRNVSPIKTSSPAFPLNSRVVLYVTNVDLLDGEDAAAFRLNVEDANGRRYRFPVVNLQSLKGQAGVFALTIELRNEFGFYEQPILTGDVSVSVAWRGLESNHLRLGLGKTGGFLPDQAGMQPSPMPSPTTSTRTSKNEAADAPDYIGYKYSGDRTRFMEQATFGPTATLDERIRRIGLRT